MNLRTAGSSTARSADTLEHRRRGRHHGKAGCGGHEAHAGHLLTGEAGSISSATRSLICASLRMCFPPKRGMLVHAFTRIYFSDEPANANDPVNAQSAAFIAPVGGTLSGLGVRQSLAPAASDSSRPVTLLRLRWRRGR